MERYRTDILVVGGGTGGTVAAIQAARQGQASQTQVTLVSEFSWLGGMLTSAGVSAPDGNEVLALQTGLWGAFLQAVQQRQPGGVDHGWVSCFTFEPQVGARIFAEWVQRLPNLRWIAGQRPLAVTQQDGAITAVTFADYEIEAKVILDGTELGDVMALADVPCRWGWDWPVAGALAEPSAPGEPNALTQTYPVQLPTWVVVMHDFGEGAIAPEIPALPIEPPPDEFAKAWDGYGPERFMTYGRLPGDRFMINWPQCGNDYGNDLNRLVQSEESRQEWLQEARWHTQAFARHIQTHLGRRYGLAADTFPPDPNSIGGGAYALHPYYRESRRLRGLVTVQEQDLLPVGERNLAPLPINEQGEIEAIAIGNYANDHHYPAPESQLLTLAPKSMRWGGRWTGTPFALPYRCLIPETIDGFLVCEKNISVSHIANGATRLQPTVMNIGQAAGMAASLCIERNCQPRDLPVRVLQEALLTDAIAPAAVIPFMDRPPHHPQWLQHQRSVLEKNGYAESVLSGDGYSWRKPQIPVPLTTVTGRFERTEPQRYILTLDENDPHPFTVNPLPLITLNPSVNQRWKDWPNHGPMTVMGHWNAAGPWFRTEDIA